MKNVVLISADFPVTYYQFAKAFKKNGCNVLVIGGTPYNELHPELKAAVTEYVQCGDMINVDRTCEVVGYFQDKYGKIDFLESNNEFWLRNDSIIRERFGIDSGIYPHQLDELQKKSAMKKAFIAAGAHVAPFLIVRDLEGLKDFAKKYGFPLFAKPDIGVGAAGNYKIDNSEQLEAFYYGKPYIDYICEPFVKGRVISFDGIANKDSEVVICANEIFPPAIYDFKNNNIDMFYYVNKIVPPELEALGRKIIKALGLKNRFFHTELFLAENSVKGHFKEGDIVPLEVNIRTPGGYTPDLLNFGLSTNLYQMFADIICFGKSDEPVGPRYYSCAASRRNGKEYFFTEEDILRTFKNNMCQYGDYPDVFAGLMGDRYYMAKFSDEKDIKIFEEYVGRLANKSYASSGIPGHLVGEDKRILDEQNAQPSEEAPICDRHIDGA